MYLLLSALCQEGSWFTIPINCHTLPSTHISIPINDVPIFFTGKHKHLFKRYNRRYSSYEVPAPRVLDFTSSWSNMNGWLSPRAHVRNGRPLSPLYSRLLHNAKPKRSRGIHLLSVSRHWFTLFAYDQKLN